MNEWIAVAIAIGGSLVLGGAARSIVVRLLGAERRPEALRASAGAIGGLLFSVILIVGLLTALGIVDPSSLETMPESVIAFVPKALSVAVLMIGGNIAASFASVALDRTLAGAPPATRRRAASGVKVAILGAAALLSAGQLGVNTTILNLAAASLFFSVAGAFALLTGLGGRAVSAEIAAGRAVRRMIGAGDHVVASGQSGTIVEIHPAAIELELDDGTTALVPHSLFLDGPMLVRRPSGETDGGAGGPVGG